MDGRQQRGLMIAKTSDIKKCDDGWAVPSQSSGKIYTVQLEGHEPHCNCPDCEMRRTKCKHIWAVEYYMKQTIDSEGNTTTMKSMKVTYTQDWKAYNKAQTGEVNQFDALLKDLVESVEKPEYKFGRPRLSLKESAFCTIQKVYSQLSSRRAHSLYKNANERGQITHPPNFNAINKLMNKEDITPILQNLITLSSMPLKSVEHQFAVDSSGFRTTSFNEYCKEKHRTKKQHRWVKAHICCGVKTNIICSAEITDESGADCPQFAPLVKTTSDNGFNMHEVTADKAYSSKKNLSVVSEVGGTPYIPFKTNATGKARGSMLWSKMYHYFQFKQEEFAEHYHKRSNVETTFHMIKSKFGDSLKSKSHTAQVNEMLCKIICHNVCVVIHEVHELGISPTFCE